MIISFLGHLLILVFFTVPCIISIREIPGTASNSETEIKELSLEHYDSCFAETNEDVADFYCQRFSVSQLWTERK